MNAQILVDFLNGEAAIQQTRQLSPFADRALAADPVLLATLQESVTTAYPYRDMAAWWAQQPTPDSDVALATRLRQLRKRVFLATMIRDVNQAADLEEVVSTFTELAKFSVRTAYDYHYAALVAQYGAPLSEEDGRPQPLLVVGMGKLGGGELNASSDIDLIFIYPDDGVCNGPRAISNHEFFTKLGQRLIKAIGELTAEGFVFRVDMRLRPYGDSGPLVMSFAMLETYLITQGREWERYAWMKAEVLTGEASGRYAQDLMALVQPFVFRKHLDFGAIAAIRELHGQIRREVTRRDRVDNIKLGPGGIREIEFIAQLFQLIRGGRHPRLQVRSTRGAFALLVEYGFLPAAAVEELCFAYDFLRRVEHRLQYLEDQQTQDLPTDAANQQRIAQGMGYDDCAQFLSALTAIRRNVSTHFEGVFSPEDTAQAAHPLTPLWRECTDVANTVAGLAGLGYRDVDAVQVRLSNLKTSARYEQLPTINRQRVDILMPQLIAAAVQVGQPDITLTRLLTLIETICRRDAYLALLAEHPHSLARLATLYAASPWVSEYVTRQPVLLDELLDARVLYTPFTRGEVCRTLRADLDFIAGDFEQQMNVLRHFHHSQIFRLVAQDLAGMHSIEALGDRLAELADVILGEVLRRAWQDLRQKHRDTPCFAIIGYGKLGGKEPGYASDLDIIFLYDDPDEHAAEHYARLAKRLSAWLTTPTAVGTVYELDLRLRPNGESGLLVSSIAAFEDYQQHHAWVWEHQALTRARFVAGDAQVGAAFERTRVAVLTQVRDAASLRTEILGMRQKMHDGKPVKAGEFDLKHSAGGLVDVEFCVQYLVLAHAATHPTLTQNIGNIALLHRASQLGLLPEALALAAGNAYRELRAGQHTLRLAGNNSNCIDLPHFAEARAAVIALWACVLG